VRSITLSIREQLFIDAAICAGTGTIGILGRHILPNALAPLIVSATFTCAGAVITEAYLSFLGAGAPSEIPTWGNIMAEGRAFFRIAPWAILIPGCILALLVLSINIVGDGLRDMVDPRLQKAL
jgi:peptide/nickel transport system permease protein